jgi:hypothetical protein
MPFIRNHAHSLTCIHFLFFSDTCMLDSNGSTKFLESLTFFNTKQGATIALVLECYYTSIKMNIWE